MKEIEKIIAAYEATDWLTEKAALGTVVKVEESAYRRIGARMYVSSLGHWTGGISGGCLEGDALKRARMAIHKNESSLVVYDTMDDDSHQIGVGLGCNGRIEVLFTPVHPEAPHNPIAFLKTIIASRQTEVLLQILQGAPSASALTGRFFPVSQKAELAQLIQVPVSTIEECIAVAKAKKRSKVFRLSQPGPTNAELLVELIRPKIKVICIGDNYDINAFVRIADELGWEIHVSGKTRKLDKEIFRLSTKVYTYQEAMHIPLDEHTAVVLMSHDYHTDFQLLQHFLRQNLAYIGLLGPKNRTRKMQTELAEQGQQMDLLAQANIYSPTGLDIGAESPEEIALSITAEIVAVLRGRDGQMLRERNGPIHQREA